MLAKVGQLWTCYRFSLTGVGAIHLFNYLTR